jgi:hypothetical protein
MVNITLTLSDPGLLLIVTTAMTIVFYPSPPPLTFKSPPLFYGLNPSILLSSSQAKAACRWYMKPLEWVPSGMGEGTHVIFAVRVAGH